MNTHKEKHRVVLKQHDTYKIKIGTQIKNAKLKGSFYNRANRSSDFPHVGDWVNISINNDLILIEEIEKRKTQLSRKTSGVITEEQVLAANIDYVIIVLGLDRKRNYSDRLLERYMVLAWNSGATPIVLLNKADLNDKAEIIQYQLESVAPGAEFIISSTKDNYGISNIYNKLTGGKTAVFIGPSGVGKSTISNTLLKNQIQRIGDVRSNNNGGKHTTSSSKMLELENGGFIIDSPGLREIQLWAEEESLDNVFDEIAITADQCKYKNCSHQGEPGCAVQNNMNTGYISPERYDSYLNLKKELDFLERRKKEKGWNSERQYDKNVTKYRKSVMQKKVVY
ncbi:putative ribosome biogenesis GTPase RsgA [Tenacibaculum sp. KUL118]|nr:putative ribosome biogenesis GTPase RsgA [Tenacibaculum sp. KUL118]